MFEYDTKTCGKMPLGSKNIAFWGRHFDVQDIPLRWISISMITSAFSKYSDG